MEVDLDAIAHNVKKTRRLLKPATELIAVVKADAYGYGAVEVAKVALANGAGSVAVSSVDEGLELRQAGIRAPILIFTPSLPEQASDVVEHDLVQTVCNLELAQALARAAKTTRREKARPKVHVKIDTGMGRIGIYPEEAVGFIKRLLEMGLEVAGVYTHFAAAHRRNLRYTRAQFERFLMAANQLQAAQLRIPLLHVANSAALLDFPEMHLDAVRPGNLVYGQYPSEPARRRIELREAWKFKTRVIHVKEVPAGTRIGYGATYVTRRPTLVATLPIGYADGFNLEPVHGPVRPGDLPDLLRKGLKKIAESLCLPLDPGSIFIKGVKAELIGKVSMGMATIDVSALKKASGKISIGDEVELIVRQPAINRQIPRLYFKDGLPWRLRHKNIIQQIGGLPVMPIHPAVYI
ncbi:MAG: alanine racemase [Syntrophothermus sp.]